MVFGSVGSAAVGGGRRRRSLVFGMGSAVVGAAVGGGRRWSLLVGSGRQGSAGVGVGGHLEELIIATKVIPLHAATPLSSVGISSPKRRCISGAATAWPGSAGSAQRSCPSGPDVARAVSAPLRVQLVLRERSR